MTRKDLAQPLSALADQLFEARRSRATLPGMAIEKLPDSLELAYAVQDRLIELEGNAVRVWKIGAQIPATQKALGLNEPFSGPIFEDVFHASPANFEVTDFAVHLFEPEVALRLGCDLPASIPLTRAAAEHAIESLHPAVEIINWRFANTGDLGPKGMIADYATNGGFVLGAACPPETDYWALQLQVRRNGQAIAGRSPPVPGTDPVELLVWFARHMSERGYSLNKGDIVTTGSQAGVLPYSPGDIVEADFGAAGLVKVQF